MNIKKWVIILLCFIAFWGVCSMVFSSYAKPTIRQEIKNPIFTIGDENYALALKEGKNVVKFGSIPLGIYSGGLAFPNQQAAMIYLERMNEPKQGWNVYQLSGDFEQDTYFKEGQRYINKSLLVIPSSKEDKPKSDVMLKLFSINTNNQLIINIPENAVNQCIIDEFIKVNSLDYAKGTQIDKETGEKTEVLFDYKNILAINHNDELIFRFIAPFMISGSGTGNFKYIGLFELNKKTNNINHIDTEFLGDRIILEKLKYNGNENLEVIIKTHDKRQALSEVPKITKILKFNITDSIKKDE